MHSCSQGSRQVSDADSGYDTLAAGITSLPTFDVISLLIWDQEYLQHVKLFQLYDSCERRQSMMPDAMAGKPQAFTVSFLRLSSDVTGLSSAAHCTCIGNGYVSCP